MTYTFINKSADGKTFTYQVTMKLYRGCEPVDNNHAPLDPTVPFSVYNNDDNSLYKTVLNISLQGPHFPNKQRNDPCIINPPTICYEIGTYTADITLPVNKQGYTVAYQRCCRNDLLLNVNTSNDVGATYFTIIPGTENGIPGDDSPVFSNEEAVLVCSRGKLNYSYAATDANGDELTYSFYPGYIGGTRGNVTPIPTPPPPYTTFAYQDGFSADAPLGPGVTINKTTGEISGRTNLQPGTYDVCVAVYAHRNGKLIATHLKDFQVDVHDCHRVVLADIPPLYNDCKGDTIHFPNNSTPGKSYLWDFGDGDSSTAYTPVHYFKDTGVYHIWLKVDPTSSCGDSISAVAKIYPGLKAGFSYLGNCLQFPTRFKNTSVIPYGGIDSIGWDFGDPASFNDTSGKQNPVYQYTRPNTYAVAFTLTTTKGCVQSDTQSLRVYDKPPLSLTPDTILCYPDRLQLSAQSLLSGTYQWTPAYHIQNAGTATPEVYPGKDTTYRVTFTDTEGCVNTDSVHLRVVSEIHVTAGDDTTICAGDPVMLHATSDGDYVFTWRDDADQVVATSLDATAAPVQNKTYTVEAALGTCHASDVTRVTAVPYPVPYAAPDTAICYGDQILLRGGGGAFYRWTPGGSLNDSTLASPLASPLDSTRYTLTVTDTLGCPKPVSQDILVGVIPPIRAFAGNDTIVSIGQTIQLHASGGNQYRWSPFTGLSDPDISDPLVDWRRDISYQVKVIQAPEGCFAYDTINLRYITGPAIYVPNAFTPNGDGRNDVFRPIPVGITHLDYFRVYNRWGQLVFETTTYMQGWHGGFKGKPADAGGYVWVVMGEDLHGKTITKKGTVILIR
jgi:gliding motility-associated-like protein